jgi:hypothetical protein
LGRREATSAASATATEVKTQRGTGHRYERAEDADGEIFRFVNREQVRGGKHDQDDGDESKQRQKPLC